MRKRIILFMIIGFESHISGQVDPLLAAQFQAILDQQVNVMGHHGVSACVILEDGSIWKGQSGMNHLNSPISEETVFIGASTTKTHVATLMLLLQEEGLLELDDTWSQYITLPISIDPNITIRQLISHTSGIADYLESVDNPDLWLDPTHEYTPLEIIENFVPETALFQPGSDFEYSNSNFVIAGMVIEAVTSQTLSEALHQRIWDPLELSHTHLGGFELYNEEFAGIWWSFGDGLQSYNDIEPNAMFTYGFAAGNILSTPSDEAVFLTALLNGEILSESSMQQMQTYSSQSFSTWTQGYGLGIHHASANLSDEILGHDGYYLNLTSMFRSMSLGCTIVTMTNTQLGWFGIFDPLYEELSQYLSIVESDLEDELVVFPNPSEGTFSFALNEPESCIEIHDSYGQLLYRNPNYRTGSMINLHLPSGLYVFSTVGSDRSKCRRLVIR
jgi:D-alanyl-D-alanine carboxypeptidase